MLRVRGDQSSRHEEDCLRAGNDGFLFTALCRVFHLIRLAFAVSAVLWVCWARVRMSGDNFIHNRAFKIP